MTQKELKEFIDSMNMGQEIEFSYLCHSYFLQPWYSSDNFNNVYILYDCENNDNIIEIFRGVVSDILEYQFYDGMTIGKDYYSFLISSIM